MPIHRNMLGVQLQTTERVFSLIAGQTLGAISCSVYENVIKAGAIIPLHKHAVEEVIICQSGQAECSFNGMAPEPFETGSVVIIPPNTPHTIRNIGDTELRQLAFFSNTLQETEWIEPPGSVQ